MVSQHLLQISVQLFTDMLLMLKNTYNQQHIFY